LGSFDFHCLRHFITDETCRLSAVESVWFEHILVVRPLLGGSVLTPCGAHRLGKPLPTGSWCYPTTVGKALGGLTLFVGGLRTGHVPQVVASCTAHATAMT
jgi:hypothetical protein